MSIKTAYISAFCGLLGGLVGGFSANFPEINIDIRIGGETPPAQISSNLSDGLKPPSVWQSKTDGARKFRVYTSGLTEQHIETFKKYGECLGLLDAGYFAQLKNIDGDEKKAVLAEKRSLRKLYGELTQSYVSIRQGLFTQGKTMDHPYWASRSVTKKAWSETIDALTIESFELNAKGHGNAQVLSYSEKLVDLDWYMNEVARYDCASFNAQQKEQVAALAGSPV